MISSFAESGAQIKLVEISISGKCVCVWLFINIFLLSKIKAMKHAKTDKCFLLRLGWGNEKEHGLLLLIKK